MSFGYLHLFDTANHPGSGELQTALLRQGLGLRLHSDVQNLVGMLQHARRAEEPSLVLLCGSFEANCEAARALRAVVPAIPVMAVFLPFTQERVLEAMAQGVVACWPASLRADMLASALYRLMSAKPGQARTGWCLKGRGWQLESPQGITLALTSAERALMLALCAAPAKRLAHAALVGVVSNLAPEESALRRPSVLVSRLRRKFTEAGLEFPIRSLRGVGYELSVELSLPADLPEPVSSPGLPVEG